MSTKKPLRQVPLMISDTVVLTSPQRDNTVHATWLDVNKNTQLAPEQELMLEVLKLAIADYRLPRQPVSFYKSGRRKHICKKTKAEEWLFSDETSWEYSFINICDGLGLNPSYVRKGINGQHKEAKAAA